MKNIRSWIIATTASLLLFVVVRPTFAQIVEGQVDLAQFLTTGDVIVGSEIGDNGFRQIYYLFEGNREFITNTAYTNGEPVTDGDYIAWMGQVDGSNWQIFLHHIPTNTTSILTNSGNNANPKIEAGRVVWEGWTDTGWQVFFFNSNRIFQLTTGDSSLNPSIEGDNIIYTRRDAAGTWRAVVYSISERQAKDISVGEASKNPRLSEGRIILGEGANQEEFPLSVDDLFVLDLPPLVADAPRTVTEDDIEKELQELSREAEEVPLSEEELQMLEDNSN